MSNTSSKTPTVHFLKTHPEFFKVVGDPKPFEVRKDDRGFAEGDILWLAEWNTENQSFSGMSKKFLVSHVLRGEEWGVKDGYCVMGLGKEFDSDDELKAWLKPNPILLSKNFLPVSQDLLQEPLLPCIGPSSSMSLQR